MNFVIQSTLEKTKALNWSIGLFTAFFTLLFHKVDVGLNLSIIALLLLGTWAIVESESFRFRQTIAIAFFTSISALANAWYGTPGTIIWLILSLLLLSQKVYYPRVSVLLSESKAFLNFFLAPFDALTGMMEESEGESNRKSKLVRLVLFVVIPLGFTIIFASIYKNLNPIFEDAYNAFLNNLDLNIVLTAALGLIIGIIFLRTQMPDRLIALDQYLSNDFDTAESGKSNRSVLERQVGITLFATLNIVLLVFLVSDFVFIGDIASGAAGDYANYVHEGVGLLIFSILVASAFIFYFFRKSGHAQLANNDALKALAMIWVALNIGILVTTGIKNLYYVGGYSLTIKRIGVFIYLIMAASGMTIAFLKLVWGKTNVFIFRNLYWSFFVILSINNFMDWSRIITSYNIHAHQSYGQTLDWKYLLSLNDTNLPIIVANKDHIRFTNPEQQQMFNESLERKIKSCYNMPYDWRDVNLSYFNTMDQLSGN